MIKFLRKNIGYPASNGIVPNGLNDNFKSNRYTKNIDKAKLLIKEYKDANSLNDIILDVSTDAQYLDVLEFVQSELKLIGINLNINITPPSILRQGKATGKFQMFRASWIADYGNPENYFSLFYSKNHTPFGPNYTYFSNEKYDILYEKTMIESDKSTLKKTYNQLEDIIQDYAPIIPLYYDMSVRLIQKNIYGLNNNPFNLLSLKSVYKK